MSSSSDNTRHEQAKVPPSNTKDKGDKVDKRTSELDKGQRSSADVNPSKLAKAVARKVPPSDLKPPPPETRQSNVFPTSVPGISNHHETMVTTPSLYDVLLGRGISFQRHHGNQRFHRILGLFKERYCNGERREKTMVSEEIVYRIKNCGHFSGRFLKRDEKRGVWLVVSDDVARYKVAHAIRDNLRHGHWVSEGKARKRPPPTKSLPAHVKTNPTELEFETDPLDISQTQAVASRPESNEQSPPDTAKKPAYRHSLPVEEVGDSKQPAKQEATGSHQQAAANPDSEEESETEEQPQEEQANQNPYENLLRRQLVLDGTGVRPAEEFTENVIGQVFNLEDVPPELLRGSNVFVTYINAPASDSSSASSSNSEPSEEED